MNGTAHANKESSGGTTTKAGNEGATDGGGSSSDPLAVSVDDPMLDVMAPMPVLPDHPEEWALEAEGNGPGLLQPQEHLPSESQVGCTNSNNAAVHDGNPEANAAIEVAATQYQPDSVD